MREVLDELVPGFHESRRSEMCGLSISAAYLVNGGQFRHFCSLLLPHWGKEQPRGLTQWGVNGGERGDGVIESREGGGGGAREVGQEVWRTYNVESKWAEEDREVERRLDWAKDGKGVKGQRGEWGGRIKRGVG